MVDFLGSYAVFVNADEEVMIAIGKKDKEPLSPKIVYDGGEHAIFYHRPDDTLIIDYIDEEARPFIKKSAQVLIAEFANPNDEEPQSCYPVPLKIVPRMPEIKDMVDLSKITDEAEMAKLQNLLIAMADKGLIVKEDNEYF